MLALLPFLAGMKVGVSARFFFAMNFKAILEKIEVLLSPILESLGFELIEREYAFEHGRWILRLYIDHEEGPISIADCERVSRVVEAELDVADIMPGPYSLEVSSPGIDRPLRRPKDFERFQGKWVSVQTLFPIDGRHHFARVQLKKIQEGKIAVQDGDKEWIIPLEAIKKAKLKENL